MTQTTSGQIAIESGQLYYELAGEGPVVAFLHGFGVDSRTWRDQIGPFSERYTTLIYDLRGFGRSSLPNGPYRHYEDLRLLLDALGIRQAALVGSSLGGRVCFDFAISYPERVSAVVSVSGVPSGFKFDRPPNRPPGPDPSLFQNTLSKLSPEKAAWMRGIVSDYSRWHRKNKDPRLEIDPPAVDRLDQVRAPVLVAIGSDDHGDFHRAADALVEGVSGARKVLLGGGGHLPYVEIPNLFNEVTMEFLDSVHATQHLARTNHNT